MRLGHRNEPDETLPKKWMLDAEGEGKPMLRLVDRCRGNGRTSRLKLALSLSGFMLLAACAGTQVAVLTYHNDNNRTGSNINETTLTPANVASSKFGLLPYSTTIAIDDQVDTQPLVVPGLTTVGGNPTKGDDVVYVTTENNSVYAIDGWTGNQLAYRNLGTPVQMPQNCGNNGRNVGINGTPVIDQPSNTMYVIAYTMENNAPVYRIHALDITTLQDKVPTAPLNLTGTGPNGWSFPFQSTYQRQRAALLEANGNIYAAFASFCDQDTNTSEQNQPRGWVLGWTQWQPGQTTALAPLAGNFVTDQQQQSSTGFYLSSIWMSGSGLATSNIGTPANPPPGTSIKLYIYAVVGNSNPNGATYNNGTTAGAPVGNNYSESVIALSPDLTQVVDWFTPNGATSGASYLDENDLDFGSGGILMLPGGYSTPTGTISTATGPVSTGAVSLASAAGKDGTMYVLNAGLLGHGGPNVAASPAPLASPFIGACWCNQSYFYGNHGPTIVSSGGGNPQIGSYQPATVQLWSIPGGSITPSGLPLTNEGASIDLAHDVGGTGHDGGFFTSTSGLGTNAIIWAVPRANNNGQVYLYALSQTVTNGTLTELFKGLAGTWPNMNANSNIVPVVANGHVYVASNKQLSVFGLSP
jgi:hypothetical protein